MIVASKAKGRVIERLVERGDDVKTGQLLLRLESPELMAQLRSAQASRDEAQAQLDQSLHGTREESIRNLRANLAQAEAQYQNAQHDYDRNLSVASKGYVSKSELTARAVRVIPPINRCRPPKPIWTKALMAIASNCGRNMKLP